MLVYKTDTDQEADVTVWANGKELVEHSWPNAKSEVEHPYIRECFIKVAKGDRITVKGVLRGTFYNASFDLLGDGSLIGHVRGDNRTGDAKKRTRKFEFNEATSANVGEEMGGEEAAGRLNVGSLHITGISSNAIGDAKDEYSRSSRSNWRPGLGSIAVVINISQADTDHRYGDQEFDIALGSWSRRNHTTRKSGIAPSQQLVLDHKASRASKAQRTRHFESWSGARLGGAPWAKLIFYYRTAEEIDAAGCVARDARTHLELRPSEEPSLSQGDDGLSDDHNFSRLIPTPRKTGNPMFVSPRGDDDDDEGPEDEEWSDIRVGPPRPTTPGDDEDDTSTASPSQIRKLLKDFRSRKTPLPAESRDSHNPQDVPARSQTLALQSPSPRKIINRESRRKTPCHKRTTEGFDHNEEAEDSLDEIGETQGPSTPKDHLQKDILESDALYLEQYHQTRDLHLQSEDDKRSPRSRTLDPESSPEVPLQRKRKAGISSAPNDSCTITTGTKHIKGSKAPHDDAGIVRSQTGTKSIPFRAASVPVAGPSPATSNEGSDGDTAASVSGIPTLNDTIVWVAHNLADAPGTRGDATNRNASTSTGSAARATAPPPETTTATAAQQLDYSVYLNDLEEMREIKRVRLAELEEMRAHIQKMKELKELKETLAREIEEIEMKKKEESALLHELSAEISMRNA